MTKKLLGNRTFDARPDRIDYRDRVYDPPLVSLPGVFPAPDFIRKHLPSYAAAELVLDQGKEGACTGFGLAAVVNYLLWKRGLAGKQEHARVSPRMLYHLARIYDEWPGEDYEGSSCRGAMKGWHRHGVCTDALWPYRKGKRVVFLQPKEGWQGDAASRPLGAYYRVNKDSVADLQAAIFEVGAVYASAAVHDGWFLDECPTLPVIPLLAGETGGHAFALVGYTPEGFIVQNSWGPRWGYCGFAVLTYEDWVQHGSDAWVAVLGAPMAVRPQGRTRVSVSLTDAGGGKADWSWRSGSVAKPYHYRSAAVQPWSESRAYEHTVVLGNDGRPINSFLTLPDAASAVEEAALRLPLQWLKGRDRPRIALYAHGGLNGEEASLKRIRVMAPYFLENGVYPLFFTWRTGFLESVQGILEDSVKGLFAPEGREPERGWLSDLKQQLEQARDRSVEVACEQLLVKPVWTQMKQNAAAAVETGAGLSLAAGCLAELRRKTPGLEIHLAGHSAGSILFGHLLGSLAEHSVTVRSITLYAPACTVGFALRTYAPAAQGGVFSWGDTHFDILSDERERADTVGPYGKSLLYLVSRALEDAHKTPLLGMEAAWVAAAEGREQWNAARLADVAAWRKIVAQGVPVRVHTKERAQVSDGREMIPLAHGSFDNDVDVVTKTLERITGGPLAAPVESLHGF